MKKRIVRKRKRRVRQLALFAWEPLTLKYDTLVERAINSFFAHPTVVAAITAGRTITICPGHRCLKVLQYKEQGQSIDCWIVEVWGEARNARECCHSTAEKCWPMLSRAEANEIISYNRDSIVVISKPDVVRNANPEYYLMALHILNNNPYVVKTPRQFAAYR